MAAKRSLSVSRRQFLKFSGAAAATAALGGPNLARAGESLSKKPRIPLENRYSVCDMCFNKCGLIARVRNGVVQKLDPNPKFLKSRGMLCARGNAGLKQLYAPDRLKYPLLRVGKRGEGKWKRISWDKALDLVAEKFSAIAKKYTRCGVAFMAGSDMQSTFVHRFGEVFGSYNRLSHESMCLISGSRGFLDTFGEVPFPDLLYTKYVVMAGANRFEALVTPDSMDLMTAMKRGAKLVVLDPRYTKTAALADQWHPIRPGTDMAFMLAVAHVLIKENLYDKKFVAERTFGIEKLAEHVKQYSPEWAEKETGIPAKEIVNIARELGKNAPASMVYPGRRTSDYSDSTQIRRSFAIVNALLGNWDRPGGLTASRKVGLKGGVKYEAPFYESNPDGRVEDHKAKMMFEEEGSFKLARDAIIEGKPYPVKGFLFYKTNPMQTGANRGKTLKMFDALDFVVTIDIQMSDTAWMSDLVLPSQCYLERQDPASALQGSSACACVVQRDPVVPAMFEAKPVFWMMKELAGRMKLGKYFNFTIEDYRKAQFAGLPNAAKALAEDGVYYNPSKLYGVYEGRIFKTKSKKIELYNQRYAEMKTDPMPVYRRRPQPKEDQFRLVVGRNAVITQSSSQNNALLQEWQPTNHLWIHPKRAAKLGIKDGDRVKVKSQYGSGSLAARVTSRIRPDTVYMATGFGVLSRELKYLSGKGAAIAAILKDGADELSGNMAMHETFVTVSREGA